MGNAVSLDIFNISEGKNEKKGIPNTIQKYERAGNRREQSTIIFALKTQNEYAV